MPGTVTSMPKSGLPVTILWLSTPGMLGYGRDELQGRRVESILNIGSRIFYQTHFFPLVKLHGRAEEIFLLLRAKSGDDLATMVRSEVLRGAALAALAGIAAGTIAGLFATRYLEASLYGISRRDPMAYLVGGGVLLAAALLGAYVPALRSSRVDPLLAIRGE